MKVELERQKRVLICPLNWGLGHASRMIPIIKEIDALGYKVMIAAEGGALKLLQSEFPAYYFFDFKGYKIRYSRIMPLALKMFLITPRIFFRTRVERFALERLLNEYMIDIIISDNRFGLFSKKAYCIYITHQVLIKMPFIFKPFQFPMHYIHKWYMKRYNECWIPDYEDQNISIAGDLTHKCKLPKNAKYIGILSRFLDKEIKTNNEFESYDLLVILSGPEPQRTVLERKLVKQIEASGHKTILVRGLPENRDARFPENITVYQHLNVEQMKSAIKSVKYIISRSGYSTIMDLLVLKKNAILIPTPGQTEQEYLAKYFHEKRIFFSMKQKDFKLDIALQKLENFKKMPDVQQNDFTFLNSLPATDEN